MERHIQSRVSLRVRSPVAPSSAIVVSIINTTISLSTHICVNVNRTVETIHVVMFISDRIVRLSRRVVVMCGWSRSSGKSPSTRCFEAHRCTG